MLYPLFKSRSFADVAQPAQRFRVAGCSWSAFGGPESATLTALPPSPSGEGRGEVGRSFDLSALLTLLRSPVELYSADSRLVWWGLVHAVKVQAGALTYTVSLDDLANRVQVAYASLLPESQGGGQRATTAWLDDVVSQAAYGIKEAQLSLSQATPAQAAAKAAAALLKSSRLQPVAAFGRSADTRISLDCRGWYSTLAWRYYTQPIGLVENLPAEPPAYFAFGHTSYQKVAESFAVPFAGFRPEVVFVHLKKVGAPSGNVLVSLCSDSSGAPGTVLGSYTILNAVYPTQATKWTRCALPVIAPLASGTYWITLAVDGALDASNYWQAQVGYTAFSAGAYRYYNGSAWSAYTPDCDLFFRFAGTLETTEQIRLMAAATSGGQFLTAVRIDQASGLFTNPYRPGDSTALEEIQAHLQAGTSAGLELLAEVTPDRALIVKTRPDSSTAAYKVTPAGVITLPSGKPAAPGPGYAGSWALLDVPWSAALAPEPSGKLWLDRVEYDSRTGQVVAPHT